MKRCGTCAKLSDCWREHGADASDPACSGYVEYVPAGIVCTETGCLASIQWAGNPVDLALGELARRSGWQIHEGNGWLCPTNKTSKEEA